nr:retrovirus-related Pol polyprotein from transposon TNT 1-94 [Tanacetum cinerariifolium]
MLLMEAQENGVVLDEKQLFFITGGQANTFDADVDEAPIHDLALNEENAFQADQCDAFDSDVDEAPTVQTMFMANQSSAYPIYDEAGPSYDSDILSETSQAAPEFDTVFEINKMKESLQEKDNIIRKLKKKVTTLQEQNERFRAENEKVKHHYKELYDSIKIMRAKTIEKTIALLTKNENLKAQIKGKMKCVTMDIVKPKVLTLCMDAVDIEPILPHHRTNREVHLDYLKHLKESVETVHEIVEEARMEKPLDNALAYACLYTK